ncbi:2-aminoethylphosphonate aminotransferase [Chengkuizengella marina]|uniref:2-aminoethylphosphonate--pyruvate transaminase n=1 Tax=Chengkuizengella marina TaxID=2507566 RepID=A0A6N9Q087_9BACL|nr:2-aminoethylphosphonate--pyruvate transaminase [Chengkuizengella marina]NBI28677.1 2-aminoethylphosphonate--pyruvate transaminase [Chengkuizengella marina]
MNRIKRNILLNPGPATTTDSVKWAQVVPDICPREDEFGHLMNSVTTDLTQFVADNTDFTTVLFSGSGTSAVEAILCSSVSHDETLLIINNGAYGERMVKIADTYKLNYEEFNSLPYEPLDLELLEQKIQTCSKKITHLAVVHHETTTGLLNQVKLIGDICAKHDIDLIVDAMSTYAAIPIQMDEMNISYLAASSNKNLQGMAGISFVIAKVSRLEQLKHAEIRSYYLNLYEQYKYFFKNKQMRFTPPVQTMYALKQAIIELKEEGISERYARYTRSWERLISGISRLGLSYLVPEAHHSKIITAIIEPDHAEYNFPNMHQYFYKHNIMIYPGKLNQFKTFRIANIGAITYKDIDTFLELLEHYLTSISVIKYEL